MSSFEIHLGRSFSLLKTNARYSNRVITANYSVNVFFCSSCQRAHMYVSHFAILGLCAGETNI